VKRRTLVAGALLIAASTGLLIWKPWREPYSPPEFDSAVFIDDRGAKETSVTASDLPKLRAAFAKTYRDPSPPKWIVAGFLRLESGGRPVAEIMLGTGPYGPGSFRVNDVYYRGFDVDAVLKFLPIPTY